MSAENALPEAARGGRLIRRDWYSVTNRAGGEHFRTKEGEEWTDHLGNPRTSYPHVSTVYIEVPLLGTGEEAKKYAETRSENAFLDHINRNWYEDEGAEEGIIVARSTETVPIGDKRLLYNDPNEVYVIDDRPRTVYLFEDLTVPDYQEDFILDGHIGTATHDLLPDKRSSFRARRGAAQ